jgi:hypothetical protein
MKISKEKHLQVIQQTMDTISDLLVVKGVEYIRNDDPLHNFNVGSKISGEHPAKILDGFLMKHYVSYRDLLNDLCDGKPVPKSIIEEKFNDILVYFLLQKSIFTASTEPENLFVEVTPTTTLHIVKTPHVCLVPIASLEIDPATLSVQDLASYSDAIDYTLHEFAQAVNNNLIIVDDFYIRFYD